MELINLLPSASTRSTPLLEMAPWTLFGPCSTGESTCPECGRLAPGDDLRRSGYPIGLQCMLREHSLTQHLKPHCRHHYSQPMRKAIPKTSTDVYLSSTFQSDNGPRHNRRSYDAIFQTVRRPDGSKGLYTSKPVNVGATALWLQFGKHTSTPWMLALFLVRREVQRKAQACVL